MASSTSMFSYFLLLSLLFFSSASSSKPQPQTCSLYKFSNHHKSFSSCSDLPVLDSFLHWNYNPSNQTAEIAYPQTNTTTSRWHAWAINPTSTGMVGSQAIIAYQDSYGIIHVYTSPITSYNATNMAQGNLSFPVSNISAIFENDVVILFATLMLPGNKSEFHHVWQDGPINGGRLGMHPITGPNSISYGGIDFMSGNITSTTEEVSYAKQKKKFIHRIVCGVSWGILTALEGCPLSAYIIGVVGFGLGLKLGSKSAGIQYKAHRNMGISMVCLGTLQIIILGLRPKEDHKHQRCWDILYKAIRYTVVILSQVNVFEGFSILKPDKKWMTGYIAIVSVLQAIDICLIILLVWRSRKKAAERI